jgi:hypothetical protein
MKLLTLLRLLISRSHAAVGQRHCASALWESSTVMRAKVRALGLQVDVLVSLGPGLLSGGAHYTVVFAWRRGNILRDSVHTFAFGPESQMYTHGTSTIVSRNWSGGYRAGISSLSEVSMTLWHSMIRSRQRRQL